MKPPGVWTLLSSDTVAHEIQVPSGTPQRTGMSLGVTWTQLKNPAAEWAEAPKLGRDLRLHCRQTSKELAMLASWCALPLLG